MKKNKNDMCPVKTTLNLKPDGNGKWVDEYGRLLEVYTNSEGKTDLRPIGLSDGRNRIYG